MNVSDQAGETARTVVEALKSTPAILALVLFNLAFMGIVAYSAYTSGERWEELLKIALEKCK